MDAVVDLAVIATEFTILVYVALGIVTAIDHSYKHREKIANRIMKERKAQYQAEVKQAGERLLQSDKRTALICENISTGQNIKYTGVFSGKDVEDALLNERR